MCELMGLSFARPVSADFTIREFGRRGDENADGWGLGWYPDRSVAIVKEPLRWQASQYTSFLESYHGLRSPLYIAHVRHQTIGGPVTHADTQPFTRELQGREYCFAHNGTLPAFQALRLGRFTPVGSTDSEHLFCHVLEKIRRRGGTLEDEASWGWLQRTLLKLNTLGTMNLLFADGRRLFGYHDAAGHKGLAFRAVTLRDHHVRRLEDDEMRVDLDAATPNNGWVVASRPLSDNGWQRFQQQELIVLEQGALRFSSHRDPVTLVPLETSQPRRSTARSG